MGQRNKQIVVFRRSGGEFGFSRRVCSDRHSVINRTDLTADSEDGRVSGGRSRSD
jgi:hypothetical protein